MACAGATVKRVGVPIQRLENLPDIVGLKTSGLGFACFACFCQAGHFHFFYASLQMLKTENRG